MKKTGLLIAGVCLLSGMVAWSADPVTSVNAVGVVSRSLPAGYSLMSIPFNAVGGESMSLSQIFGTTVPDSTVLYVYSPSSGYLSYGYVEGLGWLDEDEVLADNAKILRGEGFWIQLPSPVTVAVAGEVPGASVSTNTIDLVSGYQMVSFSFPAAVLVSGSGLTPTDSDVIYKYENGDYTSYSYVDGLGWLDEDEAVVDVQLDVGAGYWYQSAATGTNKWNQAKPYLWP